MVSFLQIYGFILVLDVMNSEKKLDVSDRFCLFINIWPYITPWNIKFNLIKNGHILHILNVVCSFHILVLGVMISVKKFRCVWYILSFYQYFTIYYPLDHQIQAYNRMAIYYIFWMRYELAIVPTIPRSKKTLELEMFKLVSGVI